MIGEQVGDWIIDAEVGHDPRGRTYRAHAAADPAQIFAIRVLAGPKVQTPEFHDLFRGRLLTLRKLNHPAIVSYMGGGIVHNLPYFVAEYIEGPDLQTLLREGKRPPWPESLAFALHVASALRHAHRRGVLHGDLRPANLYRTVDGQVKIAQFGNARLFDGEMTVEEAAFRSPEQGAGRPATKRSDFYAFGCLLYALTTGRPPFAAANLVELTHKHCFVLPERPAHFAVDLPDEFDALIMRLLAKDPQARPASGTVLLAEIERVWAGLEARGKVSRRPALPADELPAVDAEEVAAAVVTVRSGAGQSARPLMSRPVVVVPLFLLVVGILVAGFYFSRTTPDDVWAKAQPLMASADPADWEAAWTRYLEPLSRDHPEYRADEIQAFRQRTESQADFRRALTAGRTARPASEAERFYRQGLQLARVGEFAAARHVWERTATTFAGLEGEAKWVEFSKLAAAATPVADGSLRRPQTLPTIRSIVDRAKALRAEGKVDAANAVLNALEALYRDDPDWGEIQSLIRAARGA